MRVQRIFAEIDGFLDESDDLALFRGICVSSPFRKVAILLKSNRECLDHYFIVFGELRLRRILEAYTASYKRVRTSSP